MLRLASVFNVLMDVCVSTFDRIYSGAGCCVSLDELRVSDRSMLILLLNESRVLCGPGPIVSYLKRLSFYKYHVAGCIIFFRQFKVN